MYQREAAQPAECSENLMSRPAARAADAVGEGICHQNEPQDRERFRKLLYSRQLDDKDEKYTKQCIAALAYDDAKRE